jgi:hypothetical protein
MTEIDKLVENYFAPRPKTLTKQMLYEMFDEVTSELPSLDIDDKQGPARQLELALVDAANQKTPQSFKSLAQLLVSNLGYTTGAMVKNIKPTQFWLDNGGSDTTPKADLAFDNDEKVSLKFGPSQFMSGQSGETKATAAAAFSDMEVKSDPQLTSLISKLSNKLIFGAPVSKLKTALRGGKVDDSLRNDLLMLEERLGVQQQLQNYFNTQISESNDFKYYFIKEAMTGNYKFGVGSEQAANRLMVVAGKRIIYNPKYAEKINLSNIDQFFHYDEINEAIISKYIPKTNLLVKFKTDSEKIKKIKTGRTKAREVVGLMVAELSDFVEKRKEYEKKYVNERLQIDFDVKNIHPQRVEVDEERLKLAEDFAVHMTMLSTQKKNFLELIEYFGLDFDVQASPEFLDFWQ